MITYTDEQGSDAWLAARRGVITASRFRDARDKLKSGKPTGKSDAYAYDLARERAGGLPPKVYVSAAMQTGTEQEPFARAAYEMATGNWVDEAGFITDDEGQFGVSVDGLVDSDGMVEIKTMVSSATLFNAAVFGDISEYVDQCNGAMWLLGRQWCDLILWAPDMPEGHPRRMTVIRIVREEASIDALESDLLEFWQRVKRLESELTPQAATPASREALAA